MKTQKQMFLLVSGSHICAPQRDVNIQSFIIIWVKRFSEYLAYEISYRPGCWWGLLSSFISQILDFLYWMVCIFIFMASQWKQRMDYFDDQHTITVPMINLVIPKIVPVTTTTVIILWSIYEIIHFWTAVVDESEEWSSQ